MSLDDPAINPQKQRPAVFRIVHASFDPAQRRLAQKRPYAGEEGAHKLLLEHTGNHSGSALNALEQDIARKTVGHYHVEIARQDVSPFAVAHKIDGGLLEELISLLGELAALFRLCPVVEQSDAGFSDTQYPLSVG